MSKKKIISKKGFILGAVIVFICIGGIGGLKIYKSLDILKPNNQNNIDEENKNEYEDEVQKDDALNEQDNEFETLDNEIIEETELKAESKSNDTSSQKTTNSSTSSNQTSTNKQTTNSSTSSNTEQNKPTTSDNIQTESKTLTKKEIEKYIQTSVPDFRYDFDSIKECEIEGNKWMEYGWVYNCVSAKVPNTDVVPTMLKISTGKLFCDGAFTKNEEYDYRKPKMSNLEYLRSIGYPCTNIEDN